ncbi:hypothetical protein [Roseivirga sp. E12]|uniref:hypothetical protein n=1 Tax=Roseivirga sp. E12 TaxID=2819237 RepID=UPI001ABC8615|nr:hypothetical protein [Roseivirga sp. E12]MBO3698135.1 hypothetical protein [Roseivirga sp. E12]
MWTLSFPDFPLLFGSKKRKLYKQSRADFYEGRNALVSHASFDSILNLNHLESLNTEKGIQFYGLSFGQSFKETIKRLGKPNYIDNRKLALKHQKTIYYRLTIKEERCVLQMHFHKDRFFFGKMEIKGNNPVAKRDIGQLVCQKYGIAEQDWTGSIIDASNNKILIKENIIPNVCYISGDKALLNEIRVELNSILNAKKYRQVGQSELLLDMV